jgi:hypothetical protein
MSVKSLMAQKPGGADCPVSVAVLRLVHVPQQNDSGRRAVLLMPPGAAQPSRMSAVTAPRRSVREVAGVLAAVDADAYALRHVAALIHDGA